MTGSSALLRTYSCPVTGMGRSRSVGLAAAALTVALTAAAQAAYGPAAPVPEAAPARAVVEVATPELPSGESIKAQRRWREARGEASAMLSAVASGAGLDVEGRIPETGQLAVELGEESLAELRRRLAGDPRVLSVRADRPVTLRYAPSDFAFSTPDPRAPFGDVGNWNLVRSKAPAAWDIAKGSGAEVAVIDSGIDASHPDLRGRLVGGVDCTPGCGPGSVADDEGHGTHVAGLACGDTDNGFGVASMGFDCDLWVARVTLCSSVAQAIVLAANRSADAINLSLGDCDSGLISAIDYAWARGSVPVAAAANTPVPAAGDYPSQRIQPEGSGPDLNAGKGLVVTAADYSGQKASFAQGTNGVSVAAFGASSGLVGGEQGILSTWPRDPPAIETGTLIPPRSGCNCRTTLGGDDRFAYLVGTSMAAPQVAGLVALMRSVNPGLDAPKLVRLVKLSAANCATYRQGTGWGPIDAERAVAAAAGKDLDVPSSRVSRVTRKRVFVESFEPTCSPELPNSGVQRVSVFASVKGRDRLIGETAGGSIAIGGKKAGKKAKRGKKKAKRKKGFHPKAGRRYGFYSVAVDGAGNQEAAPQEADVTRKFKKKRKKKRKRR